MDQFTMEEEVNNRLPPQPKAYSEGGFDDFILYDKVPESNDVSDRSSVQDGGSVSGGGGGSSTRKLGSQMLRGLMYGPIQLPEQLLERSRRAVPTVRLAC
ncbi:unnamed protein product [Dibothriocephalus latus]|uniref:Uncharacterized protein n=1 Tax=Dibothriocephalus latus TaxID=60516 RepID=A0A3P6PSW2_DIBLA|nr:unnamed protein product [Dibothriocephalus latus]